MIDSLRSRITASLLALLVVVGGLILILVLVAMRGSIIDQATARIEIGRNVVQGELNDQVRQLQRAATVLAHDFGFKQAVATRDEATVRTALINQGGRIGADLVAAMDPDEEVNLAIGPDVGEEAGFPFPEMTAEADRIGSNVATRVYAGHAYQIVVLPVLAPERVGWTLLGFRIDGTVLSDLAGLAGTDLSLIDVAGEGPTTLATTVPQPAVASALSGQLRENETDIRVLKVAGSEYLAQQSSVSGDPGASLRLLMQEPLTQALEPYRRLRLEVFAIIVVACLLAAGVGVFVARGVSEPIDRLVQAAGRIGRGEYFRKLSSRGVKEVRTLAGSFNAMQEAIAEREARILHQAHHDNLTDLANRVVAVDTIREQLAADPPEPFAVILIDLNRFKQINDTLGHSIGDQLLISLAGRLTNAAREGDLVARLGGDEFMVILGSGDREQAELVAQRIGDALRRKISVQDIQLSVEVSLGIALAPEHGTDPETLMRRADIAMYGAKSDRQPFAVYEAGQDERHLHQLSLINDLREAIGDGGLTLNYQPKIQLSGVGHLGVEALVRWTHPEHGFVSPGEFIPLAEQAGMISDLTNWVIEETCRQLAQWDQAGIEVHAAVNISAMDLADGALGDRVCQTLEEHGLAFGRLCIEVTESAIMADPARATEVLSGLRERGVRVSIDDFGTGQSSLAQLKRLPVDELKIDRSFVQNVAEDAEDRVIVESTVALAHRMGLEVVAEGIETQAGRDLLTELGCDRGQGYLISRPLTADQLGEWIREQSLETA